MNIRMLYTAGVICLLESAIVLRSWSMFRLSRVLACVGVLAASSAMAFEKPPFPRISNYFIGGAQNYEDAAVQQQLAKFNFSVLTIFPGWDAAHGMSYQQMVLKIKALNPNTMVFPYLMMMSSYPTSNGALPELSAKLDAQHWWLYASGTSGNALDDPWPGQKRINSTLLTATDSNGDRWVDWFPKWAVNRYYSAAPAIDGFWTDGVATKPNMNGDWNVDGAVDDQHDASVGQWYRQGYAHYFGALRSAMPGKYLLGNIADWGKSDSIMTEYSGMLNGGLMEGMIGYSWSVENWGGWQGMMSWYRKTLTNVAEPKLVQFHALGSLTDYQNMRYGLASCLMDDGYFVYSYVISPNTDARYGEAPWFDEYDAKLGYATSAPAMAEWQSGVYRRDFQNGIALVNPKGNGARQVFLEADYVKLSGSQAPGVNNGQTVRSVTLQDRDGIILMRAGAPQSASTTTPASTPTMTPAAAPVTTASPQPAGAKVPVPPPSIAVH
jgi:hypothetical protein